jgi:molybdopterin/thiamine biosynthesis adenylyltransferase/ubiquitin-protein ligase
MKWAMSDPARFLYERAELERLENETDWLVTAWRIDEEGTIEVDLDLTIHGLTYAGRMTYPDVFPNSPPYIRPRNPSERWTAHQYGAGGSLCLQWRADNWQTHVTGADIVQSAFDLLNTEQHPEQPNVVPSAHCMTAGQLMCSEEYRFVATNGLIHALIALPLQSRSTLKTHTLFNLTATVKFVSEISTTDCAVQAIADLPSGISSYFPLFAWKGDGLVFRTEVVATGSIIESVDDLSNILSEAGLCTDDILVKEKDTNKYKEKMVVLLGAEVASLRVFSIVSGEQPVLHEYKVIMPSDLDNRLPEEYKQLSKVRVGIVGLGSIGSKVAISLARSGVQRFLLVDDDYLVPGNLVRHELSWAFVGLHKVNAVRDALRLVAAGMDIDVRSHRIAGQESALNAAATLKDLANCDLLIDATANPEVFLRMAAIAKTNKKPLFWGELFASGYGGLIARACPDLDPNPLAVRSAINAHLSTLPPAPFQQAGGYDVQQEQPLIAYDSDVSHIAASLTRFAIDAALQRNPSQFPYPVYLIGLRREWIFEQPFDTRPIDAQGEGWDEVADISTKENRLAAVKVLLDLYGDRRGAESSLAP